MWPFKAGISQSLRPSTHSLIAVSFSGATLVLAASSVTWDVIRNLSRAFEAWINPTVESSLAGFNAAGCALQAVSNRSEKDKYLYLRLKPAAVSPFRGIGPII